MLWVCVCVRVCVLLRSIQKLEELNVGMENLGEVKSLTQQCNGNGSTSPSADNNNPPSGTPEHTQNRGGGVLSSTPQRTVGGRVVPPPEESPVVMQRYCMISFSFCTSTYCRVKYCSYFVLAVGTNKKEVGKMTLQAPCLNGKR